MPAQPVPIFTVGHSNHSLEHFLEKLLRPHRIAVLVDVRSTPYSRFASRFDRDVLPDALGRHGIRYVYGGDRLGGRPADPACYDNGRVRYDRVARADFFQRGLEELVAESVGQRVALVCAEKEPLDCHRTLLVAQALAEQGVQVGHILADGRTETHADAITRLLWMHDCALNQRDLFGTSDRPDLLDNRTDRIAKAIALQAEKIGFALSATTTPQERAE